MSRTTLLETFRFFKVYRGMKFSNLYDLKSLLQLSIWKCTPNLYKKSTDVEVHAYMFHFFSGTTSLLPPKLCKSLSKVQLAKHFCQFWLQN